MIRPPTKSEIDMLREIKQPHTVTIYAPYVDSNSSSSDDPNRIQLKNLLKDARLLLTEDGLNNREIDSLLGPAGVLLDGDEFRNNYRRGLVLFMADDYFQYYRLPLNDAKPQVFVGDSFKTDPIVELVKENVFYYVLHVGYHGAHLFKGDRYHIKKIKFQKESLDVKHDLGIDEFPNEQQFHQVANASTGKGASKPHGQYNQSQVNKDMLIKYFRKIDHKLHDKLKDKKLPLILAGVDYIVSIYRQANTNPHLAKQEILGNLENSSLDFIHKSALQIINV